jgi:HAD superfamily hydrolase (TIGR01484 family)
MTDALWLCTDLDGTFLGGPAQSRRRLYDFLEKDPAAHLMFVTGRGLESVIPLLNDPTIPTPEYVIADVGGTVVSAPSLEPVQPLQSEIDRRWVGMHAVRERLKDLDGLEVQTVPQERRLSFFAHDHTVITTVIERVAELNCDVLLSADLYLDVLPAGVNKGTTLLRLLDALKIQTDFALTAGDTLNDLALFETGLPGVVVGNAELALLEATRKRANVYHAKDHGAAGILEAIRSRSERIPPAIDTKHNGDADLVMVYHRLPFDEIKRDGKVFRRRPRSPNGIIPTLLSYFADSGSGAWVAWSLQASRSPDGFEEQVPVDENALPNVRASRIALTTDDVDRFSARKIGNTSSRSTGSSPQGRHVKRRRMQSSGFMTTTSGWYPPFCAPNDRMCALRSFITPPFHPQTFSMSYRGAARSSEASCSVTTSVFIFHGT